jgi:hypothetical protein
VLAQPGPQCGGTGSRRHTRRRGKVSVGYTCPITPSHDVMKQHGSSAK